jgi:hypothetical protein
LLGARQAEFEETITEGLLAIGSDGRFVEPVALDVLIATR